MNDETSKLRKAAPYVVMVLWMCMVITGSQTLFNNFYNVAAYMLLAGNMLGLMMLTCFAKID